MDGKFRKAEGLVAEESKDRFYASAKPHYLSYEVSRIEYSEGFTHAKVLLMCETYLPIPGLMDRPTKIPVGGDWKLEDGEWSWYVALVRDTPFGKMRAPQGGAVSQPAGPVALPSPEEINRLLQQVLTAVKADRTAARLKAGGSEELTFTNTSTGLMTVVLQDALPGVEVKPNRLDLKAGEKAVFNLKAGAGAESGSLVFRVEPTSQVIAVQVTIE